MKTVNWVPALLILVAVAFAILFPVFAKVRDVYSQVLAIHQDTHEIPQDKGKLPFLYVSWFRNGSLKWGKDFAVFDNGDFVERRVLTYAIEGGGPNPMPNMAAFHSLRQITTLPPGLSSPDAVPHGRLLIVTLRRNAHSETDYYDRRNLPAPIKIMAKLVGVDDR